MKVAHATKCIQQPITCNSSTLLNITFDSADEDQTWDTVIFLVTTLEMILAGSLNIIFIFHLRIYFVAFLMSLSILRSVFFICPVCKAVFNITLIIPHWLVYLSMFFLEVLSPILAQYPFKVTGYIPS